MPKSSRAVQRMVDELEGCPESACMTDAYLCEICVVRVGQSVDYYLAHARNANVPTALRLNTLAKRAAYGVSVIDAP